MTIKDRAGAATDYAREKAATARATASDTLSSAKERAADLASSARDTASNLASSARTTASDVSRRTADGVDANPMAALIGGLALGALAAAVLPRTRKEDERLGELGSRINDTARSAAQVAKDTGLGKLEEMGVNKDAAIDKAREIAQQAAGVVKESATAAASSVKG